MLPIYVISYLPTGELLYVLKSNLQFHELDNGFIPEGLLVSLSVPRSLSPNRYKNRFILARFTSLGAAEYNIEELCRRPSCAEYNLHPYLFHVLEVDETFSGEAVD